MKDWRESSTSEWKDYFLNRYCVISGIVRTCKNLIEFITLVFDIVNSTIPSSLQLDAFFLLFVNSQEWNNFST